MIETLEAGDVLGWSWLFEPHRWHFDAHALTACGQRRSTAPACAPSATRTRPSATSSSRFAQTLIERLQWTRLRLLDVYGHVGRP